MVGELSISYHVKLVDVRISRYIGCVDCIGNGKLPGDTGSSGKPGEVIEDGITV